MECRRAGRLPWSQHLSSTVFQSVCPQSRPGTAVSHSHKAVFLLRFYLLGRNSSQLILKGPVGGHWYLLTHACAHVVFSIPALFPLTLKMSILSGPYWLLLNSGKILSSPDFPLEKVLFLVS